MTQHVRTSYRKNRRAAWGLAIALAVAVAAVVIPIASSAGSAGKTYTFTGDAAVCAGTGSVTFDVVVTNTARTQNLGSVDLYAPGNIAVTSAIFAPGSGGGSTKQILDLRTTTTGVTPDPKDPTGVPRTIVSVRSLQLGFNGTVTVRVTANITGTGTRYWYSLAKQANNFNPGDLDLSNALAMTGSPPSVTVSSCSYVFVNGPVDAERGSPQTVKVQLQAGGVPVAVSSSLTLSALQGTAASGNFTGLGPVAPDASGTYAGKQWTFGVTGSVVGDDYALQAGSTTSDPRFSIVDGLCPKNTTDTEPLASSCSVTSNLGGRFESGVTINNHSLDSGVEISFAAGSALDGKCDPWNRATYVANGQTYTFPGVRLDFGWGGGMLKVVYRIRNSDWVLTDASRGNSDIEICAGARHGDASRASWNAPNADPNSVPFTGKYGAAKWNADDDLFWGVLASVQNPAKVNNDPAVCARGTQDLPTGPGGASETWRTWTVCIPFDWDWKMG